jgi:hypothetical protein
MDFFEVTTSIYSFLGPIFIAVLPFFGKAAEACH